MIIGPASAERIAEEQLLSTLSEMSASKQAALDADYSRLEAVLVGPERLRRPDPPEGYTRAPHLPAYQYIPKSGSPNRLLEKWTPEEALAEVSAQQRQMAEWIRGQRGRPGWDLDRPTREVWQYIHVSKRLKECRNQLQDMVDEINAGDYDEETTEYMNAQAEADALSEMENEK